jgi:hypothetical protein
MQLSPAEWAIALVLSIGLSLGVPWWASTREEISLERHPRQPYELSEDDWIFERRAELAAATADLVILGDSVVWGEYVAPSDTLDVYLSRATGRRVVQLGVNGLHPVAMEGLVRAHGRSIRGLRVLLHWNPLWTANEERDLGSTTPVSFQHSRLARQFFGRVPAYDASFEERLDRAMERYVEPWQWSEHVRLAYLDGLDLPSWWLENPGASIRAALSRPLLVPDARPRHDARSWLERRIPLQDHRWIRSNDSFQWRAFVATIEVLRSRGNGVAVLVGPFNEHILSPESRRLLGIGRVELEHELDRLGVRWIAPTPLPSELYADASHPLAAGYEELARRIVASRELTAFLDEPADG